ncbi:MAG: hypothetical protein HOW73_00600 [Polyangiaceae bacterium]|nr:hypothetical protein [Polyangiaceae bacterium]
MRIVGGDDFTPRAIRLQRVGSEDPEAYFPRGENRFAAVDIVAMSD